MKREKVTDLKEQLVELFEKEKVLAFFDFQLAVDRNRSVPGLCKISQPRDGEAKSNYLSLLFIVDTVDAVMEEKVDSFIKGISWGGFKECLRGSTMIVPIPQVSYETRHYLKEVEIYLSPQIRVSRSYIADSLYPAILKILGCRGHELIFWDELPPEKRRLDLINETDHSLLDRIIGYFKAT